MSHLGLSRGVEEALIQRLVGGQTPSSIGSEIGFIKQAIQLATEGVGPGFIPPLPVSPTPTAPIPTAVPRLLVPRRTPPPLTPPQITAPIRGTLGQPPRMLVPRRSDMPSFRQSVNALTIGIPGINLPGGITLNPFQLPVPLPRLPPPRLPPVPGRTPRMPFPIPIPIPLPGMGAGDSGACPRGFHLDKKSRSRCVRNRSMNPLNPRALKRSLRRIDRFEDFVNKTASLTGLQLKKRSTKRRKTCR